VDKNFVVKLISFSLLPLVVLALIDGRLRASPTGYSYVEDLLREQGPRAKIIFTGDSQALYDFKPDEFAVPAINISNVSQSLPITRQILEKNLSQMSCAALVVVGISYFAVEYQLYGQVDDERNFLHMQVNGVDGDGGWISHWDPRRFSRVLILGPRKSWRSLLKSFSAKPERRPEAYDGLGWYDGEKSSVTNREISEASGFGRAAYHSSTMVPANAERNFAEIQALRDRLAKDGIALVFVRPPTFTTYSSQLNPKAVARNQKYDARLKSELSIPVFDYLQDARFERGDFINNDHLNRQGAKKLAAILNEDIIGKYDLSRRCPN
jgi:hypothetical protein